MILRKLRLHLALILVRSYWQSANDNDSNLPLIAACA
jgi:hypothetical protein